MEWDLGALYKSIFDPKIDKDKKWIDKAVNTFTSTYRHKINSKLTAKELLSALNDLAKIELRTTDLAVYARLLQSKNTQDAKIGAFFQDISEFLTKTSTELLWFGLMWKALPQRYACRLLLDPLLKDHKHHLTVARLFTPHTLSEKEEVLLTKKSQTGISAFKRLYEELLAREEFTFKVNGKLQVHSAASISPLLTVDPNRKVRALAAEAYTKTLSKNAKTYAFILNTKLLDKKIVDEVRSFKNMTDQTLLSYEIQDKVVDALTKSVVDNYQICERFYQSKSKLSKLKLTELDRYSEVLSIKQREFSFEECTKTILGSFNKFSPDFGTIAKEFFDKKWIDSKLIDGKSPGAFCMYGNPTKNPYILTNFSGKIQDVETLAHELGHGIHAYLSRKNNIFEFNPSTATAEIASVFCENIVFEDIYKGLKNKDEKINMLGNRLQSIFATVFRQTAFFEFEREINKLRRGKGELSVDLINETYQTHLQRMFGKGLTLSEGHAYWWIPVAHFFKYNFYVFTYAFGELLTHALFAKYKKEGGLFVEKYTKMLSKGGSLSPEKLLKIVGVDITDPEFWNEGLKLIDQEVHEFEELIS